MTEFHRQADDEISLYSLGATLVRNRWRLLRWGFVGGVISALLVFSKPALYVASASFVPQGGEANRSGLAGLAGQFGVALPTSGQSHSSEFYGALAKSRELLGRIAKDTFTVSEMGGRRVPFLELFDILEGEPEFREQQAIKTLTDMVTTSILKSAEGVVQLSVVTRWPSVSLAIVKGGVDEVNDYNLRTKQGQAAAERKFVEGRLALAGAELRAAEDRLQSFLVTNKQFANSPGLSFERDRLQRDVNLQQQVFTSLTQSLEEVRLREVRDTPVITMFESPSVSTLPLPRGRVKSVLVGLVFGAFIGSLLAIASDRMARRRKTPSRDVRDFIGSLVEVKTELQESLQRFRGQTRS